MYLGEINFNSGLVPCGGQGQEPCQACHVIDLTNGVIEWLVMVLGTLAAIIIVYAGFKLVVSGGNHHAREEAKSMITNMIIGYVIVLAGWLLIDTAMKALLDEGEFGIWNQVQCVTQPDVLWTDPATFLSGTNGWNSTGVTGVVGVECGYVRGPAGMPTTERDCSVAIAQCEAVPGIATVSPDGASVTCAPAPVQGSSGGGVQCNPGNTACSVSALQGYGLNAQQANIMSCIAMTESSGIPSIPPYNLAHPESNSSACGTFQIVRTTWNSYASQISTDCRDHASSCQNARCNAQLMVALVRARGYNDWTCPGCNRRAAACVSRYGG